MASAEHITQAESHVQEAILRISRQQALVDRLERSGREKEAARARELLQTFRDTLRVASEHLRIERDNLRIGRGNDLNS